MFTVSQAMVDVGVSFSSLLDSGAFTAWTKRQEVVLDDLIVAYASYLNTHEQHARDVYMINLDKIPGSPGRTALEDEVAAAIKQSDENFARLTKHFGDRILPVFHQGESTARLHEVCDQAEFICISPRNDLPEASRVAWSIEVHDAIERYGKRNRTHGLATTGYRMMSSVPWWSVDSASWGMSAAFGNVFADEKLTKLSISEHSPDHKSAGKHLNTIPQVERDAFIMRLESTPFTLSDLQQHFRSRALWNRVMMARTADALSHKRAPVVQHSLFDL
jgi:hypothetical protein